jgi:hypothetical protein
MVSKLRFKKSLADLAANGRRKVLQVLSARAHEDRGLDRVEQIPHLIIAIYL